METFDGYTFAKLTLTLACSDVFGTPFLCSGKDLNILVLLRSQHNIIDLPLLTKNNQWLTTSLASFHKQGIRIERLNKVCDYNYVLFLQKAANYVMAIRSATTSLQWSLYSVLLQELPIVARKIDLFVEATKKLMGNIRCSFIDCDYTPVTIVDFTANELRYNHYCPGCGRIINIEVVDPVRKNNE